MITKDDTLMLKGKGAEHDISRRVDMIRDQIENSTSEYEKEKMQERMARLASGVAVLKVSKHFIFLRNVPLPRYFFVSNRDLKGYDNGRLYRYTSRYTSLVI